MVKAIFSRMHLLARGTETNADSLYRCSDCQRRNPYVVENTWRFKRVVFAVVVSRSIALPILVGVAGLETTVW